MSHKVAMMVMWVLALPVIAAAMVTAYVVSCGWQAARHGWKVGAVVWSEMHG